MNTNESKFAHPNKDLIIEWASGEKLQFKHGDVWKDWEYGFDRIPNFLSAYNYDKHEWRVKPKVTFCEERGYKVGDQFLVDASCDFSLFPPNEEECVFSMIVELHVDDGSVVPQFRILVPTQHRRAGEFIFIHLDNVKKIELFGEEK